MNIGAVAKLTGLSSKSIRMYEDKGIISSPARSDSGYREYSDKHIQELNLVSRAKNAGFSLQECKEFVQLAHNPNSCVKGSVPTYKMMSTMFRIVSSHVVFSEYLEL